MKLASPIPVVLTSDDEKWIKESAKILTAFISLAKRVLFEDVLNGSFASRLIACSILGKYWSGRSALNDGKIVAADASILGLDDKKDVVAFAKFMEEFMEELEEGESKPMLESADEMRLHLDWVPNFRLIPHYGGKSSEYNLTGNEFFREIFQRVTLKSFDKTPQLLWDDEEDGTQPVKEDKARPPFNKKEQWIYVNGMCMTKALAMLNTNDLANMFSSRVLCVHNPTTGIFPDLIECASGIIKYDDIRESFAKAAVVLSKLLKEILQDGEVDTVRVIGHSQGTILTTCAVEALQKDNEVRELLPKKLHAYLFANCGDAGDWKTDYNPATVEYFHNQFDFVSELGRPKTPVDCTFQRPDFYGHMLGEHYLPGFNRGDYVNENGKQSKLYGLIKHNIFEE
jgi:hypothetical protein